MCYCNLVQNYCTFPIVTGKPVTLSTEGQGVTFVYIDSTVGWRSVQDNQFAQKGENFITATGGTITTSGNCKIHSFTGPGIVTGKQK